MTKPNPGPEIADEVPWSDHVTEYDDRHDTIYLRLLDAEAEGASKEDMARQILGIDPARCCFAHYWTADFPDYFGR